MPNQTAIRDDVTARIIQALEVQPPSLAAALAGDRAGGSQPGRHSNVASRKPYQGVNPLLLELHAMRHWVSRPGGGARSRCGRASAATSEKRPSDVEEGHWGCRVVFWKPVTKTVVDDQTGDEEDERFFVLRTYTLFNADQVEGEAAEQYQVHEEAGQPHAEPDFQPAEELIAATGADIRHGGERAFYNLTGDYIQLPHRERFATLGAYYETALHELSTGANPASSSTARSSATPCASSWRRWRRASSHPRSACRRGSPGEPCLLHQVVAGGDAGTTTPSSSGRQNWRTRRATSSWRSPGSRNPKP